MTDETILKQLCIYAERAGYWQDKGDEEMSQFFVNQGYSLLKSLDTDDGILYVDTSKV